MESWWCLWDMSGNTVKVTNQVLFCKNVIVCDMLSNGEIIYRLRKFSTRVRGKVRWES